MPHCKRLPTVALLGAITLLAPPGCDRSPTATNPSASESGAGQTGAGVAPAGSATAGAATPAAPQGKQNIVLICVDTLRADALGCYGNSAGATPNMDQLAAEGARFAQCVASTPDTLASHATILTGLYPFAHGARATAGFRLADDQTTLAETLSLHGYATRAEIASALLDRSCGVAQGFDEFAQVDWRPAGDASAGASSGAAPATERDAVSVTDAALAWLSARPGDKPFFLYVHYFDPHQPYKAPPRVSNRFVNPYVSEVAFVDQEFGRLLATIRQGPLAANTAIVLTSDHGEALGQHAEPTHGLFLFDSTLHVPLIVWRPGVAPAGLVVEPQVRLVDVAPTVLDLAGVTAPPSHGASLRPLLAQGAADPRRACYCEALEPKLTHTLALLRAIRVDGWKYVHSPKPELYNLREDPREGANLIAMEAPKAAELRDLLRALLEAPPPGPGPSPASQALDAGALRRLAALGYLTPRRDAEKLARELDSFEPTGGAPSEHIEPLGCLDAARAALLGGRKDIAERMLRRLLEFAPEHPVGLSLLGKTLAAAGKSDEAQQFLRRSLEADPGRCEDERLLASLLIRAEQFEEAEQRYRAAIACDPTDPQARQELASLLMKGRRVEEALSELDAGLKASGPDSDLLFASGGLLDQLGRREEATRRLEDAVRLDPTSLPKRLMLARVCARDGKVERAGAMFEQIVGESPADAQAYLDAAGFFESQKDWPRAIQVMERGFAKLPENLEVTINRAWQLSVCPLDGLRDGATALELAKRVADSIGYAHPVALETLALAQAESGDFENAERNLRRALQTARSANEEALTIRLRRELATIQQGKPWRQE